MSGLPLVSIVTPSYNQAAYLESTIRSVLDQDYAPLEYLIVDGGSTDGSFEIIQKYAGRLAWWVSEKDSGQAEAINKGLQRASGEIVAWLNSDDLYLPGAIQGAVRTLQGNSDLGMVYGDAITVDHEGQRLNRLAFKDWGLKDLMGFRIICQPAVFMRKAVLEKAGYLDPSYHFMLDHLLWIKIASLAPIWHIPTPWAAARQHPEAKNVAQAPGFGEETFRILEWMETQPDLAKIIAQDRKMVEAGAYRLKARYLLDGGQPGPALKAYWQATLNSPSFALKHWHRMVYAGLSLVGGQGLAGWYYRLKRQASR